MAPIPVPVPAPAEDAGPRLVLYYQTMHTHHGGPPVSLLPLLDAPTRVTHIILAALHIHADDPANIRLNDNLPADPLFSTMWAETAALRRRGAVKILAMLGGAAPGSFSRDTLDAPTRDVFLRYYEPLRDLLRKHALEGIDLDVEQEMSLPGIIRLIDALRADFGPAFIITLAPVAAAMLAMGNMSGFDYLDLEAARGRDISWYNVQFYNNWGDLAMVPTMGALWPAHKLVLGQLTSPENGNGHLPLADLRTRLAAMSAMGVAHGGVMGWEYFNSVPAGKAAPWLWAREVGEMIGTGPWPVVDKGGPGQVDEGEDEAGVPGGIVYHSDGDL